MRITSFLTTTAFFVAMAGNVVAQETIPIGNLVDFTGATAVVGKEYGQAKIDAIKYINRNGGINGKRIKVETIDYGYIVPRALAAYKKWTTENRVVAIQGWGTGDTEALVGFVARDRIPYFSASYSGHLTDPTGIGPKTKMAAPYNFPMGPSYSDGVRALIQWARADWDAKGKPGRPRYVHMGDNDPYPNAPKAAGESYARELGFDVVPVIRYTLTPGDFQEPCTRLMESRADYTFLANTSNSNISLLKSCAALGVATQFMSNIWGYDENVMKAAGAAANGVVWVMGAAKWGDDVPGMKLVREISKMSNPSGRKTRAVHYLRGVCAIYYMKEAMEWADSNGGITGANIKQGMYQNKDWVPAGLKGVCPPGNWSSTDHRGFAQALIYRGDVASGGDYAMSKLFEANIPRKPEWLGW